MEDTTKLVTSLWSQLINAPAHLLLLLVLLFFGMLLKKSPLPNYWIPWFLIAAGVVTYPLLASPKNINPDFTNPALVLRLYGALLGVGAMVGHRLLRKMAWFQNVELAFVNAFRDDEQKAVPAPAGGLTDPQKGDVPKTP